MKRFLSGLLITALVLTTGIPAFAAEADSTGLEKAINAAKNVVTVPESFSDFNYSTSQTIINGKTYTYWNLSWNDIPGGGSMYATVDENGNLTNYYYYINGQEINQQGLSKITKAQGLKTASDFLAKAIPGYGNKMKQVINPDQGVYGTDYQYIYKLYVNNIPVDFAGASVSVNRYTGEISNYYYNGIISDLKLTNYPAPTDLVGIDAAGKAFIADLSIDLKYYSYYDYIKETLKIFPVYETNAYGKAIDAKTGKVVTLFYDEYGYPMETGGKGGNDGVGAAPVSEFTEEEQAAIEATKGLIEKSAAEQVARDLGITFGKLTSISLSTAYVEKDKYLWNMQFEKGYATVNAANSELVSFSLNIENTNTGGTITNERAKVLAEAFINKISPEKLAASKYFDDAVTYPTPYGDGNYGYINVNFIRQANGIDFSSNSMNVTIDKRTGKIVSYYSEWYDKAVFPSIEKAITPETAFGLAAEIGNFGLIYKKTGVDQISLVYDFTNGAGVLLDGITGNRINWDGTIYSGASVYKDIKGNWAEKIILELQENGYYLPTLASQQFKPQSTTTQIEFLRYLYAPIQAQYVEDDSFYNMLVTAGIVKKGEVQASQMINRQETAKFIVRYLGYDKLAAKTNIFKNLFKDTPQTGYQGYAAICYGFDIMKGNAKGNFDGSRSITHAEVAKVIYQTLKSK